QVQRLIAQAISHENLCQSYIGWCPFVSAAALADGVAGRCGICSCAAAGCVVVAVEFFMLCSCDWFRVIAAAN
ncbi:hypothetical protein COO60DRAFT_1271051, partial [Scenedesmus sp. NREL 46B-D3]